MSMGQALLVARLVLVSRRLDPLLVAVVAEWMDVCVCSLAVFGMFLIPLAVLVCKCARRMRLWIVCL